jgi:hypothetical protein
VNRSNLSSECDCDLPSMIGIAAMLVSSIATLLSTPSTRSQRSSQMIRHTTKGEIIPTKILDEQEIPRPDPGAETDFEIENNKFAFSPRQLGRLYNPKSLNAFHALGGLDGLKKGLRGERKTGLGIDKARLDGIVTFNDTVAKGEAHQNIYKIHGHFGGESARIFVNPFGRDHI